MTNTLATGFYCLLCYYINVISCEEQKPVLLIAVLAENCSADGTDIASVIEELAVDVINNNTSVLPDYQLQLVKVDSGCDDPPGLTPYLAATVLLGEDPIVGMVGPTCSSSAAFVGSLIRRDESSPVNIHVAVSGDLERRSSYLNSFGIVSTSNFLLHAAIRLIRANGWNRVNILYDESRLYHTSAFYELDHTLATNFSIKEHFVSSTHLSIPDMILESRIILLFVSEDLAWKILCLASHRNITYPAYQFVVTADYAMMERVASTVNSNHCGIDIFMAGTVFINFEVSLSEEKGWERIPKRAAYYLDAFWSLSLALHATQQQLGGLSSSSLEKMRRQNQILRQEILALDFDGYSGKIRFSNSTGFVHRNVSIHQYTERQLTLLATLSPDTLELNLEDTGEFLPWEIVNVTVYTPTILAPKSLAYLSIVLTGAVLIGVAILHTLTVIYRRTKSVKASSYKMLHLAYTGSYLLLVCSFAHTWLLGLTRPNDFTTRCYLWHVVNMSLATGLTMIMSMLCVRTWRLYRIFIFYKNPGRLLSNRALAVVVFACVSISALVSLLWVTLDPLTPVIVSRESELDIFVNRSVKGVQMLQHTELTCQSSWFFEWFLSLHAFTFILSLVLAVLMVLTRKIPQKIFKADHENVMRMNYMVSLSAALVIAVYVILLKQTDTPEFVTIRFVLMMIGLNANVAVISGLLYLPPLYPTLKNFAVMATQKYLH